MSETHETIVISNVLSFDIWTDGDVYIERDRLGDTEVVRIKKSEAIELAKKILEHITQ